MLSHQQIYALCQPLVMSGLGDDPVEGAKRNAAILDCRYHPLPWNLLTYDTDLSGYVVDLDKERLEGAPWYEKDQEPTYDQVYLGRVAGFYRGF